MKPAWSRNIRRVRACVCACVRACVRACVLVCALVPDVRNEQLRCKERVNGSMYSPDVTDVLTVECTAQM